MVSKALAMKGQPMSFRRTVNSLLESAQAMPPPIRPAPRTWMFSVLVLGVAPCFFKASEVKKSWIRFLEMVVGASFPKAFASFLRPFWIVL